MSEPERVWVVRIGEYSDEYVAGVYPTLEEALEAFPPDPLCRGEYHGPMVRCGWHELPGDHGEPDVIEPTWSNPCRPSRVEVVGYRMGEKARDHERNAPYMWDRDDDPVPFQ